MSVSLALAQIRRSRVRALLALMTTCALWGLSFPTMKALGLHVSLLDPRVSTWFVAAATLVLRFGSSAALLALSGLPRPTRAEWRQGLWISLFAGTGMLFQMDALNFTSASTGAFLTQGYIVILPIVAAISARALPSLKITLCALTIAAGLAVLSGFDWSALRLGRGETETLMAAFCFTFQILCLDHRAFRANRTRVVSILMFAGIALLLVPVALLTAHRAADARLFYATPIAVALVLVLSVPCTAVAFSLMNRYQPVLSASEAGIIYGVEPLCASLLALFLPGFLAGLAGVSYANERLTERLLVGGGLVIIANVLLQLPFGSARAASSHSDPR
jgi:drug/metabolite transporter (DMT)-like permease